MYPLHEELGRLEEKIANIEGVNLFLFLGESVAPNTESVLVRRLTD
ncbi:MAG: hypothetical protein H8F28_21635 [Fibrella sp.]|nr:hypothetical protein [Armatimonadota bacterium]